MTLDTDKFEEFERLISNVKDKRDVHAVVVESPQVLGDTYEELVANLNKLAGAELAVVFVPPSDRAKAAARRN